MNSTPDPWRSLSMPVSRRALAGAAVAGAALAVLPGVSQAAPGQDVLRAGERLRRGQSLRSLNGRYRLIMQRDGNLVQYENRTALWWTGTNGPRRRAKMQADGNFVVYSRSRALWSSGTAGFNNGTFLALQDDGNLVMHAGGGPLWASKAGYLGGRLSPGATMEAGATRRSPNGKYWLFMQADGNLVLYDGATAVWNAGTNGPGRRAVMQTDGNFVVYAGSQALWHTSTGGQAGARLEVQDDGNLVVYRGGTAVWARRGLSTARRVGVKESANSAEEGYCTWGAKEQWKQATGYYPRITGHAYAWDESAAANGWTVTATPEARSIFVENSAGFGHCGWVRGIERKSDGTYMHSTEMNTGAWVNVPAGITTGFNSYQDHVRKVTSIHKFILAP